MIYMKYNIIIAVLPLLLLGIGVGTTNQVLAWNGDGWDHGCCGPHWGVGDYLLARRLQRKHQVNSFRVNTVGVQETTVQHSSFLVTDRDLSL
jgi:hypothetical protein